MSEPLLAIVPGTIGMKCPVCDRAQIARRMAIDPPGARLAFYPCCEECASQAQLEDVVYTDANRQVVQL